MRRYSWDEWGITAAEYEMLLQAVDQGIVTARQVEDRRLWFKWGEQGVYDFIHGLDFRHRFHTDIEPVRDSISQEEFEAICLDVIEEYPDVRPSRFDWAEFHFTFPSNSRKSTNGGALYFDNEGRIAGKNYQYRTSYGAHLPRVIGDRVITKIRSALYSYGYGLE